MNSKRCLSKKNTGLEEIERPKEQVRGEHYTQYRYMGHLH